MEDRSFKDREWNNRLRWKLKTLNAWRDKTKKKKKKEEEKEREKEKKQKTGAYM
jgi:hypothetical protein